MKNIKLNNPMLVAEQLIENEKLILPIDLSEVAKRHNITLQANPAKVKGASGMLIRYGEDFTIIYATHINNEGFQRFSIAHEFGHYFLPSHHENVFRDGSNIHESHAGFCSNNQIELEADYFAAALLMPKKLFLKEAHKFSDGIIAIENLAKICKTSLVSSAIRYAELTQVAVAIVISSADRVEYSVASKAMYGIRGYTHLKKGSPLPRRSLTHAFNQTLSNIEQAKREHDETELMHWFQIDHEIMANEEIIGLGSYGKTLTVITSTAYNEDDNDSVTLWDEPKFR